MNQVYYCPVCGFVISDEEADCWDPSQKKKCPECKGKMMATGKEYNSFWQSPPIRTIGVTLLRIWKKLCARNMSMAILNLTKRNMRNESKRIRSALPAIKLG